MKHTPGPWAFGSFGKLLVVPIVDGVPNKYDPICNLGEQHFPSNTEVYANAQLIAAAPMLLAALIKVLDEYQGCSDPAQTGNKMFDEWDEVVEARAAIAEATGEQK